MPISFRWSRGAAAVALCLLSASCIKGTEPYRGSDPAAETYASSLGVDIPSMTKINDALYVKDLTVGTGDSVPATGDVTVTYTGWLVNGTQFDTNVGDSPQAVSLQDERLPAGWRLGIPGMRVGGKRLLVVGSLLGYGEIDYDVIPANSTLVFQIEAVSVP